LVWTIEVADTALEDINALSKVDRERVLKFIYQRLRNHPNPRRLAEPLFGSLAGFGRFRVGDFRLVCKFADYRLVVTVVNVKHRREVYR
jgi:mRNA interferase RelE/StbE